MSVQANAYEPKYPSLAAVADLVRDYVALIRVAELLPETYEALRKFEAEGDLPTERTETGRIYLDRDFALRLVDCRDGLNSLTQAIRTAFIPMSDDAVSTTVEFLANEWSFSKPRVRDAASNLSNVALCAGMIETDEEGLIDLRRRIGNQTA